MLGLQSIFAVSYVLQILQFYKLNQNKPNLAKSYYKANFVLVLVDFVLVLVTKIKKSTILFCFG
jgi:hypothetical protein